MKELCPDSVLLPASAQTCAKRQALTQAKRVYAHMVKHELESVTLSVVSTLVKCGAVEDAVLILNRLTSQTVYF